MSTLTNPSFSSVFREMKFVEFVNSYYKFEYKSRKTTKSSIRYVQCNIQYNPFKQILELDDPEGYLKIGVDELSTEETEALHWAVGQAVMTFDERRRGKLREFRKRWAS